MTFWSLEERKLTPNLWAILMTLSAPTFSCSGMKYVFTERPKPVHMFRGPFMYPGLAFAGHQCLPVGTGAQVADAGRIDRRLVWRPSHDREVERVALLQGSERREYLEGGPRLVTHDVAASGQERVGRVRERAQDAQRPLRLV